MDGREGRKARRANFSSRGAPLSLLPACIETSIVSGFIIDTAARPEKSAAARNFHARLALLFLGCPPSFASVYVCEFYPRARRESASSIVGLRKIARGKIIISSVEFVPLGKLINALEVGGGNLRPRISANHVRNFACDF